MCAARQGGAAGGGRDSGLWRANRRKAGSGRQRRVAAVRRVADSWNVMPLYRLLPSGRIAKVSRSNGVSGAAHADGVAGCAAGSRVGQPGICDPRSGEGLPACLVQDVFFHVDGHVVCDAQCDGIGRSRVHLYQPAVLPYDEFRVEGVLAEVVYYDLFEFAA